MVKSFRDFVNVLFMGLLCYFAYTLSQNVEKMQASIAILNTQIAVVIADQRNDRAMISNHGQRIEKIEERMHR